MCTDSGMPNSKCLRRAGTRRWTSQSCNFERRRETICWSDSESSKRLRRRDANSDVPTTTLWQKTWRVAFLVGKVKKKNFFKLSVFWSRSKTSIGIFFLSSFDLLKSFMDQSKSFKTLFVRKKTCDGNWWKFTCPAKL